MRLSALAFAAVVTLAACAHTPDLALRPETPAPAGEDVGTWQAADGTALWQRHWLPTARERGVLVIMHGLADHSGLYDRFARRAAAAGYSVWAFDLRGHGRSAGPRVQIDSFEQYVDDLATFIDHVHASEPGQPVFLMGHSMGGAVAALTTIERKPQLAGLILSSAALALDLPPLKVAGAAMASAASPRAPALALDPGDFSSDPAVVAAMKADPLISHDTGPARTAGELARATSEIWAGTDNLTMPLLVLHGTADRLTAPAGSRAIVLAAPSTDKTLHIYDGAWHILLAEPNGVHERVEGDILAWLDAHTGGAAIVAPPVDTARALVGDPGHRVQAISIGGGFANRATGGIDDAGIAELALRFGKVVPIGLGGREVGWGGAATVRYLGGDGWDVAFMPIGFMLRRHVASLGVAGGIGTVGSGANLTIPVSAWLELPFGPVHATFSAQVDYRVHSNAGTNDGAMSSELSWFGVAVRFPGDRAYWPRMHAGVGPYVASGVVDINGTSAVQVTAGLALYGQD